MGFLVVLVMLRKWKTIEKATKERIVNTIQDLLEKATEEDSVLFYFAGHGARETISNNAKLSNSIEVLATYFEEKEKSGYLLAIPEIYYLFQQSRKNIRIVTIIESEFGGGLRKPFPARNYEEFIFSKKIKESDFIKADYKFHLKNHINIVGVSSGQSAWDTKTGGVFTGSLLKILKATNSKITYKNLVDWINISMKGTTGKIQNPKIEIRSEHEVNWNTPWLGLYENSVLDESSAYVVYNEKSGWHLTLGQQMGIKEEMPIIIETEKESISAILGKVDLNTAKIENSLKLGLNPEKIVYSVSLDTNLFYPELLLYINNIDGNKEDVEKIQLIINNNQSSLSIINQVENAAYFINIFRGLVYISLSENEFQPLAKQIDLLKEQAIVATELEAQLTSLLKWDYIKNLEKNDLFDAPPIKIEIQTKEIGGKWIDITNDEYTMNPSFILSATSKEGHKWLKRFKIRVTNISKESLNIGGLNLETTFGIMPKSWNGQIIRLQPEENRYFFEDYKNQEEIFVFEPYQEVYNWERISIRYKFFVNNMDAANKLPQFFQTPLEKPIILSDFNFRGIVRRSSLKNIKKWMTFDSIIHLNNPEYNQITGELKNNWEAYLEHKTIAPFIKKLYPEEEIIKLQNENQEESLQGEEILQATKKNKSRSADEIVSTTTLTLGSVDKGKLPQNKEAYLKPYHVSMSSSLKKKLRFRDESLGKWRPFKEITGAAIQDLQQFLKDAGFMPKATIDGIFGYGTKAAVRLFQEYIRTVEGNLSIGIPDGIVGKNTLKSIKKWKTEKKGGKAMVCDWGRATAKNPSEAYAHWINLLPKAKEYYKVNNNETLQLIEQYEQPTDTRKIKDWDTSSESIHLIGIRRNEEWPNLKQRPNDDLFVLLINGMVFYFWGSTKPNPRMAVRKDIPFLIEGQHKYRFGWHKISDSKKIHQAFRPAKRGVLVIRDSNDNQALDTDDITKGLDLTPNATINIRWSGVGTTNFSSGSQVIAGASYINHKDEIINCRLFAARSYSNLGKKTMGAYNIFNDLIMSYAPLGIQTLTYTLIKDEWLYLSDKVTSDIIAKVVAQLTGTK